MSNKLAILLGLSIVAALAYDAVYHEWANSLFLARKMVDLIEWLAFWR